MHIYEVYSLCNSNMYCRVQASRCQHIVLDLSYSSRCIYKVDSRCNSEMYCRAQASRCQHTVFIITTLILMQQWDVLQSTGQATSRCQQCLSTTSSTILLSHRQFVHARAALSAPLCYCCADIFVQTSHILSSCRHIVHTSMLSAIPLLLRCICAHVHPGLHWVKEPLILFHFNLQWEQCH